MLEKRILTGIKPTGSPHIGNYIGAIKPALSMADGFDGDALFFVADYHAITLIQNKKELRRLTDEVARTWIASGLDVNKHLFYKQSDIQEIFELTWVLSCVCPKGWMNKGHAYKAIVSRNIDENNTDRDDGVNMGVFDYPLLMAADILLFDASHVPVGKDQLQHIEIARDLAKRFNQTFGHVFVEPEPVLDFGKEVIPGLDGRKMSKSYNNTIPLFEEKSKVRKKVMRIVTDSSLPDEPKDPDASIIFDMYKKLATDEEVCEFEKLFRNGIGWGDAKGILYEKIESVIAPVREKYFELEKDAKFVEDALAHGASVIRKKAIKKMKEVRKAVGI